MKRQRFFCTLCAACMVCVCLTSLCGCSSGRKTTATTKTETTTEAQSTEPETTERSAEDKTRALQALLGMGQQLQQVDGVQVVSGRVERVTGSVYTPNSGSGFFTVNGTIAGNSEIMITFHPVSVLRYKLALRADSDKTVRAEIRLCKKGELLVSCVQEEMELQVGQNDVDVCIDTGENSPCDGTYDLYFYLDGRLVSQNEYEA